MTEPMALRMTAEDLGALARCRPAAPALAVLRKGQISHRLLLLKGLADAARRTVPGLWAQGASVGWDLCVQVYAANPRALEQVVLHPHAGVWLRRCLRALHGTGPDQDLAVDLVRLGTFGHAAALRGGLRPRLALPAHDGLLWLPTLGGIRFPEGVGTVRLDGWTAVLPDAEVDLRGYGQRGARARRLPPHRLAVTSAAALPRLSVVVEDADPYRDVHGFPVQPRQTAAQRAAWHTVLEQAWRLLTDLMPERAADSAALWSSLVPLRPGPSGRGRSSSTREAYGAVAVAPGQDPVRLAETVLHETSHIALAALTDLVDLTDPDDSTHHSVGWRPDLRPLSAVLTGAHAHLGLLDYWARVYHTLDGAPARAAEARLHECGRQVGAALRVLRRNRAGLTTWGAYFVECMTHEAQSHGFQVKSSKPSQALRPSHAIHPSEGSGVRRSHAPVRVVPKEAEDIPPSGAAQVRPPPPRSTNSASNSGSAVVKSGSGTVGQGEEGAWAGRAVRRWAYGETAYCAQNPFVHIPVFEYQADLVWLAVPSNWSHREPLLSESRAHRRRGVGRVVLSRPLPGRR
ncbi:HEXXH motif domain-containing protein [Streptomyces caeruleatus]